jgi:hypothetical protein
VCGLSAGEGPATLCNESFSSAGPAGAGGPSLPCADPWTYGHHPVSCGGSGSASEGGCGAVGAAVPVPPPALPPFGPPRALARILSFGSTASLAEEDVGSACGSPSPTPLLHFEALALHQLSTLLEQEASGRYAVKPDYMTSIYGGMMVPRWRQQLVEWMAEVVREFHLSDATYFAAVQLLDRLLSRRRIRPEELQAFALVCCIVCAKIHDSKFIRMVRAGARWAWGVGEGAREVCAVLAGRFGHARGFPKACLFTPGSRPPFPLRLPAARRPRASPLPSAVSLIVRACAPHSCGSPTWSGTSETLPR